MTQDILIDDYDYPLPDNRIAKHPLKQRDACKLLVCDKGNISETVFHDLPDLLSPDSVLVYNNTRVINARLRFQKPSGSHIEIFCLEPLAPADYALNFASTHCCRWLCLIGNSKKWKEGQLGMDVVVDNTAIRLSAKRISAKGNAWEVEFEWNGGFSFSEIIEAAGEIPVPPYLNRPTEEDDSVDYQTVYSHIEGSVAAPTAGLHFTPEVLESISEKGIKRLEVTLHVGAGTFQPVKSDSIGKHDMHSEFIAVTRDVIEQLRDAIKNRKPIYAVGTTTVRTLESLYHAGCLISSGKWEGIVEQWYPYDEERLWLAADKALEAVLNYIESENVDTFVCDTQIIIAPGYNYKIVDAMITNFHQPRSTLLLLVSAFLGDNLWRSVYDYALDHNFRFLSYGDACILKH